MTAFTGLAERLKRAVAFVAIVWGVAATFIAFDMIALVGGGVAMGSPGLLGDLALPAVVSGSTNCVEAPGTSAAPRNRVALAASWSLGLAVGREAIFRQQASSDNPQAIAELRAGVEELASAIGVPVPETFIPRQVANANPEFVRFLEADGRGTARALTKSHSPESCQLYKLGAVWGYSEVVRIILPDQQSAFALEIRHYAGQAGLPDELWRPMLEAQPSLSRAEVLARTTALTQDVTTHLMK